MTHTAELRTESFCESDWDMPAIVGKLRTLRDASLAARQRANRPPKLPSRKALASIVEELSAALFPNRLGSRVLADDSVDYFVGRTLDEALRALTTQVIRELELSAGSAAGNTAASDEHHDKQRNRGQTLVGTFAGCLPQIRELLESDILAAFKGDPAARMIDEVLACYPGITAIVHHRLSHALFRLGVPLVARMIAEIAHSQTGIDIHPGAEIGSGFFIDHGTGVVIGETAVIGQRVRLYHGVTLGAKRFAADTNEIVNKSAARHPIVEDDVVIYAGATILGCVTIGRGSVIGGNVWLTSSIPPGSVITQAQVRSDGFEDGSGI